jgi:glycolate oxidase FAD binding subunit
MNSWDTTLAPRTLTDLQEAVAASAPAALTVRGGATKWRPGRADAAALDTRGLTGIVAYDPAECVVTALAGTPVRELDDALAAHGQYLPFDPLFARTGATLGGTVAAAASGPGRYRYGGVRDFVIGAAVVDGTGQLVRSGGQVVKNAAGFLLHHGLVGSAGRYGVVGEVSLKVFPAPEARATVRRHYRSLTDVLDGHLTMRHAVHDLDALDVDLSGHVLFVRLAGAAAALPPRLDAVRRLLGDTAEVIDGPEDQRVWHDAVECRWASSDAMIVKIPATPGGLVPLAAALAELGALRATSGGAAVWLATTAAIDTVAARLPAASRAVIVRGAGCGRVLGRPLGNVFDERVRRTLDPLGRFC